MPLKLPDDGELQRRITIRGWVDQPDDSTSLVQTFDAGIKRWAKVEPVHGLAMRSGEQTGEVPTHLFWVRYGPGTRPEEITLGMVIDWGSQRYRIIDSINVNDAQRFTQISAKHLGTAT